MRRLVCATFSLGALFLLLATTNAQPPRRPGPGGPQRREDGPPPPPPSPLCEALDKDHDGVLSAEEIAAASESLKKLDKNGDGKLDEDEMHPAGGPGRPPARGLGRASSGERAPRGPERDGPPRGGRDERRHPGPHDDGPGGPHGPGGDEAGRGPGRPGGLPRSVLPPHILDELRLTDEQHQQLHELDADVRARLDRILTAEQKREIENMHSRGPGGPPPRDIDRNGRPGGADRGPRERGPGRPDRPVRDEE